MSEAEGRAVTIQVVGPGQEDRSMDRTGRGRGNKGIAAM